jgi:acyl transferase domain-containing protein/acyl carrier protein
MTETDYDSAVAIVGMAGRFPGAADVDELWRNLRDGIPGLRTITDEELAESGVDPSLTADPDYVRVGGPVADLDLFDAGAFGFSPREAETMEPQHRLFLECSWQALEAAGYPPVDPGGRVGVFAGCAFPDYMIKNVGHMATERGAGLLFAVGNERDSLTSLVSYKLGLRGPSVTVQTFCSTSLVAVHLACQSLLTYDCDMALAGGAFLPLPQPAGYLYEQGSILSPDGRVRSFDAAANGSVMGSGVAVVALKRMTDALADGDVIHAVILGSAVNNDGPDRVGYPAPGVDGQAEVIRTAIEVAGVKPQSIGYVECHATGTSLGDSIELAAMSRVFREAPATPCVLSSVKPAIGHLDRAAGVTGLIRATLSLRNRLRPAVPGFDTPNPTLAAAADRFTVLTEPRPWPAGPEPRRAGVSSFGLGGTNAHAVLEEAPPREPRAAVPGPHLLTFSAGDATALAELTDRIARHLAENPDLDLADVAYTLQVSRGRFALRRAVVCADSADALAALADATRWLDGETTKRNPMVLLRTAAEVPADWWAELADAVEDLLAAEPRPAGTRAGDRDSALAALRTGLTRLGVVLGTDGAEAGAVEVVVAPDGTPATHWVLSTVARLWLAGAAIDWAALHRGAGRRVELPTYPFQRSRYWVEPRPVAASTPAPASGRIDDPARWTYLPTWAQQPLSTGDLDERLRAAGPWLVLAADARGEALIERLHRAGAELTAARPGTDFGADDTGDFTIRPDVPDDLGELVRSLFIAPRTIVHGLSLASEAGDGSAHFTREQEKGFYSVLALVRALADDPDTPPTELVLLTSGAVGVLGADLTHPEHATLAGLAPSLAQENPFLACRHVDLAGPGDVEAALASITRPHRGPVAVRGGDAWYRRYEPYQLADPDPHRPTITADDTVLITGGLGDVGLVLARHLAGAYGCRLVLTARTPLPPRERWTELVNGDDRVARHIRNILDLERQGAKVLAVAADVGDEARMREVVEAAIAEFGGIDVVVHAAGIQNPEYFHLAHLSDRASCEAHLNAKINGFHVLQTVLAGQAPDRRITLSSLSAVLGGIALGPYSSANAGLDAYARAARLRGAGRWITVDWDTWAVDPTRPEGMSGQTVREFEMSPAEGIAVFERALAATADVAHVVISTGPLEPRLAQWVTNDATPVEAEVERERHPRPPLATPYAEPADDLERTIAEIWAGTLGLESVGVDDNFFELGGHSLIAIQLATRLRSNVSAALPVTALVEYPTVRQLAALVRDQG